MKRCHYTVSGDIDGGAGSRRAASKDNYKCHILLALYVVTLAEIRRPASIVWTKKRKIRDSKLSLPAGSFNTGNQKQQELTDATGKEGGASRATRPLCRPLNLSSPSVSLCFYI